MGETFRRALRVHMINADPRAFHPRRPKMGRFVVYSLAFLMLVITLWQLLK